MARESPALSSLCSLFSQDVGVEHPVHRFRLDPRGGSTTTPPSSWQILSAERFQSGPRRSQLQSRGTYIEAGTSEEPRPPAPSAAGPRLGARNGLSTHSCSRLSWSVPADPMPSLHIRRYSRRADARGTLDEGKQATSCGRPHFCDYGLAAAARSQRCHAHSATG